MKQINEGKGTRRCTEAAILKIPRILNIIYLQTTRILYLLLA
jgi:hypothetical protein